MPYCCQCGTQTRDADRFCAKCGAPQVPLGAAPSPRAGGFNPLAGLSSRNASLLCYIPMVGWVAAILMLAAARFRHDSEVRFHAFQGLYLFVAWLIVDWVVSPMLVI